ncbi:unnamed protein product [Clonostachys chloroleuca]|uniref:Uncharacterized protein n=1 Tax=Clonostachys chloroleuca TaxID=1926264 RepID=A0AA35MAQ8_9HYPO|nr:unnamed protein product [Clonostachys chloroleuca]
MSRYAEVHSNPTGPGDARPTALQIVKDNGLEGKLVGKVAVITGVSSGIGIETARALDATGITLFLTARDTAKAKTALAEFWKEDRMHLIQMDQTSLESVRNGAEEILCKTTEVNILIANAGVMAVPDLQLTKDGFETQFATNHLSHFLLFELLKPALLKASSAEFQSRVVVVSASAHRVSGIAPTGDYNYEKSTYNAWAAYSRSKTANIYMANEIERRFGSQGIHGLSLHPGNVYSGIGRFIPHEVMAAAVKPIMHVLKNTEQGAATTVVAAVGKEWEGRGGVYLADCAESERGEDDGSILGPRYSSFTYNQKEEGRLWEDSLKMVGSQNYRFKS